MVDRTPSSNDIDILTLDIQLDEVRKELQRISGECEGDSLSDSLAALLNFDIELNEAIKNIEESKKSATTTSEENLNHHYPTDSTEEYSQIQSDYEMAVKLSEETQLKDASLRSSDQRFDNILLSTPKYEVEIEQTDESIESPRNLSPSIPDVDLNDNKSRDSDEEDSQIQRDYWMAVLLSEEMQLEDASLKSSGKAVEDYEDVSSSVYKIRTQIRTLDQSFEGSKNSNSATPDIDSKGHYPVISTTEHSQTQDDYEMAVRLSVLEAMQLRDTDDSIESPRNPSPSIPDFDLNDNKSRDSDEEDSQIQRDYWMAVLLSEEIQLEDASPKSSGKE